MPVFPYKVRPAAPLVAVLREDGETALCEDGKVLALDDLPAGFRVWGGWDLVTELWGDGKGEALCWRRRPVRWRHRRYPKDEGWQSRSTDVRVLRTDWPDDEATALEGLVRWRDWLRAAGAAPLGSMGSTSWSLLRASLTKPLWLSVGEMPPLKWIMGGRQELVVGAGRYGPTQHFDLPAAYAQEMGQMRYGGVWREVGMRYPYRLVAHRGVLCFVRARVRVPSTLPVGPLPKRPLRAPRTTDALLTFSRSRYPTGRQVQGIWTWEEVAAAEDAGCKVRVLNVWVHMNADGKYPFLPWWEHVLEGRALPGFAGQLGKATGNALWGQFCLTPGEERTIDRWQGNRSDPMRYKRPAPLAGASPHYAPDLAETLTGRVRADLFRCMVLADDRLLCAHTDGIWARNPATWKAPDGWRAKDKASRMDLITPQFIRYYRLPQGPPEYVVAGAPATLAPAIFDRAWYSFAEKGLVPL